MTGYGSGTAKVPGGRVSVEVRSVNQRFLDVSFKGPREYIGLERDVVAIVRAAVRRGKVDVFVTKTLDATDPNAVRADVDLAKGYSAALTQLAAAIGSDAQPTLELVASQRGVLVVGGFTPDAELDAEGVAAAVTEAVAAMVVMREDEGARLAHDLRDNIARLSELTEDLEKRVPILVEDYRKALRERLNELLAEHAMDEGRLAQEVALLAERSDIHEEIVRLRSHLEQLGAFLDAGGEVGRKLDFLLQEVYREINTSGSKAGESEAARIVVEMKSAAERMREQAQNIE